MEKFIGRKEELKLLYDLNKANRAVMVVIKGRRRIGKSRLATEFAKDKKFLKFTGIAPTENVNDQHQRDYFARQLASNFKLPPLTFLDWQDAFDHLSLNLNKEEKTVILFDEISWIGDKDPTFLPKLKAWWDMTLQEYPNLMLILCGSVSTWIEKNIINSTAFFGRISLTITLDEFSLKESNEFLQEIGIKCSTYDIFKILSVTGGVPWYLEQINPSQTIDENIKRLCFNHNGLLIKEFDLLFNDLFSQRGKIFRKIINYLAEGMKDLSEIRNSLEYPNSGRLTEHLQVLITSGFISKHYKWSPKTGKVVKQSLYRLTDNYLRFYVKYIDPNILKIEEKSFQDFTLTKLSGWDSMMGFQVENLLLKNRYLIIKSIGIDPTDIVADNPYIQKGNSKRQGCQIDYLVQTRNKNLYICEFKFNRREITQSIIPSMQEKIKKFEYPKGFGICPVLFYLDSISDKVYDAKYFYRIIDITDFLER